MAFLGAIEETCTALQFVWKIAVQLKDSRKEIATVEKSMRRVKDTMILLKRRIGDSKSPFSKADAKITSMLEEDMKDINNSITEAREILEQREKIPSHELGSKMVWILYQVPNLKLIASSFDASKTNIDRVISFIHADALRSANIAAAAREKKRAAQMEKLLKAQKDAKQSHEKELRKIEMQVKLVQQKGPKVIEDAAIHAGSEKPKSWVQELVAGGMKKSDAQKAVDGIMKDIMEEHKQRPAELKRAATFRSEKGMKGPTSIAQGNVNAPKPNEHASTENLRILCVDNDNGPRSIIAEIYLEFIRSWTMNTQKRWLFNQVRSAGAFIPTHFAIPYLPAPTDSTPKEDMPRDKAAIAAIAGEDSYFWSEDPNEKAGILERAGEKKSRGLYQIDFSKCDLFLCFDIKTRNQLEKLKEVAIAEQKKTGGRKISSSIHYLENCKWFPIIGKSAIEKRECYQKICGKLKLAIKDKFLKKLFGWERPEMSISRGEWRTLQIVVQDNRKLKVKVKGDVIIGTDKWRKEWEQLAGRVKEKMGCAVHLELVVNGRGLLSVSGPRNKLVGAKKMVLNE